MLPYEYKNFVSETDSLSYQIITQPITLLRESNAPTSDEEDQT